MVYSLTPYRILIDPFKQPFKAYSFEGVWSPWVTDKQVAMAQPGARIARRCRLKE